MTSTAPDPEALKARVEARPVPFWDTLGIKVVRIDEPGHAILRLPMRPALGTRRAEVLHGGAIATLIDAAAGAAIIAMIGDDSDYSGQATLDINVSYLNAITTDAIAEARILRANRSIGFAQVEVSDANGKLAAIGRVTYSVIRK
ncbi:MAG: PaaI family thioesterase [Chloroflexi bacterium]|nr:PaaI family thioesterase [Chloroflexota bacterium]